MNPSSYLKAIVAFLLAGLTVLGTALTDDVVTQAEWVGVAVAGLGTTAGVYAAPNRTDSLAEALDDSVGLDES